MPPKSEEDRYRLLVEAVIDYAIFMLAPDGIVTTWNAGAERLKGYKAGEIIGKSFAVFYTDEDRARDHPREELKLAKQLGRYEEQGWRVRKDGSRFWANVVITAVYNDAGTHIGYGKVTRDFTERREAEESLRESEERFRLLVESARDYAIYMLDPSGRVATWNFGAQRIKGYSADEVKGKHFSIFFTPADIARRHPQDELAIAATEGSYAEEGWRVRKDGSRFWASVVITALRDRHGSLTGFGKVTRDLTEKKKAEDDERRLAQAESARETADRLHTVTTAFASAMTSTDVARVVRERVLPALGATGGSLAVRIENTNVMRLVWAHGYDDAGVSRILGATDAAAHGTYQDRFSFDDGTALARVARARESLIIEGAHAIAALLPHMSGLGRDAHSGAPRPIAMLIACPLVAGGEVIGALALTSTDVERSPLSSADRTLASAFADQCALALDRALLFERELAAKARADLLSEASLALSRTLDVDAVLVAFADLAVPRVADNCTIELFESGEVAPDALGMAARVVQPRRIVSRTPSQSSPSSPARPPQRYEFPLNIRGRTVGNVLMERAEELNVGDLELARELVRRAAAAVENAQLYAEVERAVRVRDDFMSIAGHEVRTPLAALQLTLETMARTAAKSPEVQSLPRFMERLKKALDNGERLQRLVDELLDVSRITAGRLSLEVESHDLADVVESVVTRLSDQAAKVEAPLKLATHGPLRGRWDRLRLEQVITNLIANAIKYGRGAPIEIDVGREDGFAVVTVCDHGIGIAPEDQERIFERFERAVSSERHFGGLGLGLWIARQVVEASGGTIAVASALGHGSTFTVRIPLPAAGQATDDDGDKGSGGNGSAHGDRGTHVAS